MKTGLIVLSKAAQEMPSGTSREEGVAAVNGFLSGVTKFVCAHKQGDIKSQPDNSLIVLTGDAVKPNWQSQIFDKVLIADTHFVEWMEPGFNVKLMPYPYFLTDWLKSDFKRTEVLAQELGLYKTIRFSVGHYDTKHFLSRFNDAQDASIDLARIFIAFLQKLKAHLPSVNFELCELLSYPSDACNIPKKWWILDEPYHGQRQVRQYCVDAFNSEIKLACKEYGWQLLYRPSYFFDYLPQRDKQEVLQPEFLDDSNFHISWKYGLHNRKMRGEFFTLTSGESK